MQPHASTIHNLKVFFATFNLMLSRYSGEFVVLRLTKDQATHFARCPFEICPVTVWHLPWSCIFLCMRIPSRRRRCNNRSYSPLVSVRPQIGRVSTMVSPSRSFFRNLLACAGDSRKRLVCSCRRRCFCASYHRRLRERWHPERQQNIVF